VYLHFVAEHALKPLGREPHRDDAVGDVRQIQIEPIFSEALLLLGHKTSDTIFPNETMIHESVIQIESRGLKVTPKRHLTRDHGGGIVVILYRLAVIFGLVLGKFQHHAQLSSHFLTVCPR